MLDSLFSQLAPHYCLSCGEIGAQICENCFYDIDLTARQTCLKCHGSLTSQQCNSCTSLTGVQQFVFAERHGVLERLIDEYKFAYTREAYRTIARLFAHYAPHFPTSAQIIPLPTSTTHIRRRGFDHTQDITSRFSKERSLQQVRLLERRHNHSQVGASVLERQQQADTAFTLKQQSLNPDRLYVLCDDIVTTGASMVAAISLLRSAGAQNIVAMALLQQPWKN